jgi:hypothetical protein
MDFVIKLTTKPAKGSQEYLECIEGFNLYPIIETEKFYYIGKGRFVALKSGSLPMVIKSDMLAEIQDLNLVVYRCKTNELPTYEQLKKRDTQLSYILPK